MPNSPDAIVTREEDAALDFDTASKRAIETGRFAYSPKAGSKEGEGCEKAIADLCKSLAVNRIETIDIGNVKYTFEEADYELYREVSEILENPFRKSNTLLQLLGALEFLFTRGDARKNVPKDSNQFFLAVAFHDAAISLKNRLVEQNVRDIPLSFIDLGPEAL